MKKLLFASTALVLVAGAAAAEVKVTGDGRMGLYYNGDDFNFSSRIRAKFTMSGETDGGLTFGGSFRVDQEDENGWSASQGGAGSIFISGAFGKLALGDVVGAAEAVLFDLPEVGFTDLSGFNELPFLTGDGVMVANNNPVLLYTYSTGNLTIAASMSDGKLGTSSVDDDQEYALGVGYAFGDYTIGLGYEAIDPAAAGLDTVSQITLGGTAKFADTTVSAYYATFDGGNAAEDIDFYGLGVSSKFGALTINAFANHYDYAVTTDITGYGLGAVYDLGGGASIVGGLASTDASGAKTVADIGMKFTF